MEDHLKTSRAAYAEFMVDQLNNIGMDAIGIGSTDFALGVEFLKTLEKNANFPFLSANIVDKKKKRIFKPYVIKKVGNKKIGIFSVIDSTMFLPEGLLALDALKTAQEIVAELFPQVDYILALTYQGVEKDRLLAENSSAINWIVGGHDGSMLAEPRKIKKTLILQAGTEGKYVGIFQSIQKKKISHQLIALDEEQFGKGDEILFQKVQTLKETISKEYTKQEAMAKKPFVVEPGRKTPAGNTVEYASYRRCMECHKAQYDVWKQSKHATAIIPLYVRNQHLNPECIGCHSVGFREPGGFSDIAHPFEMSDKTKKSLEAFLDKTFKEKKLKGSMIDLRKEKELDQWARSEYVKAMENEKWRKDFVGVQCENCHSAKGLLDSKGKWIPHSSEPIFPKKVVAETCLKCHTSAFSPHFDMAKDRRVLGEKDAKPPFQCKLGVF